MFDIGWSELLLIGIVALIVVGPKDLPGMFRTLGRFTAKARSLGREFQRAMDDAARESGVKDAADDLRNMTSKKGLGLDKLDEAAASFEKWNPTKAAAKPAGKPAAPKGPATQALADRKAADAAARAAARTGGATDVAAAAAAPPEPAARPKAASTPARVGAGPAAAPAAKAARKPRAKKDEA